MRGYLLFVLLLLAGNAVFAQTARPSARPDSLVAGAQAPAPDTLAAIHRLFAARRRQRIYVVSGTVLATVAGTAVAYSSTKVGNGLLADLDRSINTSLAGTIGVAALIAELIHYGQYSRRKEQRAAEAFQNRKLKADVKKHLKPEYF